MNLKFFPFITNRFKRLEITEFDDGMLLLCYYRKNVWVNFRLKICRNPVSLSLRVISLSENIIFWDLNSLRFKYMKFEFVGSTLNKIFYENTWNVFENTLKFLKYYPFFYTRTNYTRGIWHVKYTGNRRLLEHCDARTSETQTKNFRSSLVTHVWRIWCRP